MQLTYPIYRSLANWGVIDELPTAALYLLNPVSYALPDLAAGVRYCGANIYKVGAAHVVVRTTDAKGLHKLSNERGRIVYIVDDHFASCAKDESLPRHYRERFARFLAQQHDEIIDLTTEFVASSQALAEEYRRLAPGKPAHAIDPVLSDRRPYFRESGASIKLGLLAARSHQADLKCLAPVLGAVLNTHSQVRIVHRLRNAELGLPNDQRVENLRPLRWRNYRNWKPELQIGLYPLRDTELNRHRSINKLIEYVNLGAAPLVSDVPAMQDVPAILRVQDEDWEERINQLVLDPGLRRKYWQTAADFITARDPLGKAAACWSRLLRV